MLEKLSVILVHTDRRAPNRFRWRFCQLHIHGGNFTTTISQRCSVRLRSADFGVHLSAVNYFNQSSEHVHTVVRLGWSATILTVYKKLSPTHYTTTTSLNHDILQDESIPSCCLNQILTALAHLRQDSTCCAFFYVPLL